MLSIGRPGKRFANATLFILPKAVRNSTLIQAAGCAGPGGTGLAKLRIGDIVSRRVIDVAEFKVSVVENIESLYVMLIRDDQFSSPAQWRLCQCALPGREPPS
jgi:hypothetical protein